MVYSTVIQRLLRNEQGNVPVCCIVIQDLFFFRFFSGINEQLVVYRIVVQGLLGSLGINEHC